MEESRAETVASFRNAVFLDVEVANEVFPPFSFSRAWELGIAVASTWSEKDLYVDWFRGESEALLKYLLGFERVVGFNTVRFDYKVIDGDLAILRKMVATLEPQISRVPPILEEALRGKTVDMLLDVFDALGHRLALEAISEGSIQRRKRMSGVNAPILWRMGKRLEVIEYCRDDVGLERDVYAYGVEHGLIRYVDRSFGIMERRISWRLR